MGIWAKKIKIKIKKKITKIKDLVVMISYLLLFLYIIKIFDNDLELIFWYIFKL